MNYKISRFLKHWSESSYCLLYTSQYKELLDAANAEKLDTNARYEKYAAAQAWLTENAIVLPIYSKGGVPSITKVTPFSAANSAIGIKGETSFFKYQKLQDKTVTTAD